MPNFKTKGIITDIDSIAEVILVGSNKFNEISCDEVIILQNLVEFLIDSNKKKDSRIEAILSSKEKVYIEGAI